MPNTLPAFDTPKLANVIETLTQEELDLLPYGVTGLDAQNFVRVFNKTEAECSGFGERIALGRLYFFDVAPCLNNSSFQGPDRQGAPGRRARYPVFLRRRFQRQRA